ncbi:methylaspartate mutase [Nocardia sp. ET3-3]|uniref:Methylaspartate mutase n=1 Tax=Nocardia terrae TaxID=2675851 RepID=A0A7K1V6Z0_9NOCA|nr:methylaspartate mutase [Nocardia terrae]MVU82410.1 methylaspartate mutase [Nocardia terrae]
MIVAELPDIASSLAYIRSLGKPTVAQLLDEASTRARPLIQPRCGVGGHEAMRALLTGLQATAAPDIATVTVDSHTRLLRFDSVRAALAADPASLNGYPLINHGWRLGRELNEAVAAPIQLRHGSPDARQLFAVSIASGFTSFEGGGIGYNVPYAKDVPITASLRSWQEIDRIAGEITAAGVTVDRELFGTLTGVLMPPSICLATTLLEAVLAAAQGVRCLSISYPQGGHPWQDLAALRAITTLAAHYLADRPEVRVHTVLHQFMGVFPADRDRAVELIIYGGLIAARGRAAKVITKSPAEASGIPTMAENAVGMVAARFGTGPSFDWFELDEEAITREQSAIEREVRELIDPVLDAPDPIDSIGRAFADGRLDVPFPASRFVRGEVISCRDGQGAIRFARFGNLPFGARTRRANDERLDRPASSPIDSAGLVRDVEYFARPADPDPLRWMRPTAGVRTC